jgi:hypothetical protein
MSKVVLDVSMSLDGFTAGPNVREEEPMGDGGERLHAWKFGEGTDGEIALGQEVDEAVGAAVVGRRRSISALVRGVARHGRVCPASWSPIG